MKDITYQDLGIPAGYQFEAFVYVPSGNSGVCLFSRDREPRVTRIFWRRATHGAYTPIPVQNEDDSCDSCHPSPSSDAIYYSVMRRRTTGGMKGHGGYWVSLNRFCLNSLREEILVDEHAFAAMTGASSWIVKVVNVSSSETEIDVIAGVDGREEAGVTPTDYAIWKIDLARRRAILRFALPALFI